MKVKMLTVPKTFSTLLVLRISALSAKHQHQKLKLIIRKGNLWLTNNKWRKATRFPGRSKKNQSVAGRSSARRQKIEARPRAQWPRNIGAVRKQSGLIRSI